MNTAHSKHGGKNAKKTGACALTTGRPFAPRHTKRYGKTDSSAERMEVLVNKGGELVKIDLEADLTLATAPQPSGPFRSRATGTCRISESVAMFFLYFFFYLTSALSGVMRFFPLSRKDS